MPFTDEQVLQIRGIIKQEFEEFLATDRYIFHKNVQFLDGRNIQVGRTTGTRIGTGTDQKLSVYGVTPVVQAGAISAPSSPSGSYVQAEIQSLETAINAIRTAIKNFGITA